MSAGIIEFPWSNYNRWQVAVQCTARQLYKTVKYTSFDQQLRNVLLVITLKNAEFVPSNKPFTSNLVRCVHYFEVFSKIFTCESSSYRNLNAGY